MIRPHRSCSARRQRVSLQVSRCRATTSISEESKLTTSVTWQRKLGASPEGPKSMGIPLGIYEDLGESRGPPFRIYGNLGESMGYVHHFPFRFAVSNPAWWSIGHWKRIAIACSGFLWRRFAGNSPHSKSLNSSNRGFNQEHCIRNPITLGESVVELLKIYKNSWVCHESSSQLL
jgi:hypothetical protein